MYQVDLRGYPKVPLPGGARNDLPGVWDREAAGAEILLAVRYSALRACPACGSPYEPEDRFCGECGTALDAEVPRVDTLAVARRAQERSAAERRLVSVLFADLVGFTSLAESRDSEEVREILSAYFDRMRDVVERHGGVVEKFIGDAVMAVWGTPTAHKDDAERAVRTGLAMVDAIAGMNEELGLPSDTLAVRLAVMTGEVAVTVGAEGQGMVAGDLVNTASRVQSAAEPGTVLLGEATRRVTEAAIAYSPIESPALKGKSVIVPVWQALRVIAGRRGFGKSAGLEAPFVGRANEFRLVRELFHATAREGRARLVSVVGIAGIGKSRLSWSSRSTWTG